MAIETNAPQSPALIKGGVREMMTMVFPMVVSLSCDTLMIFTDRLFLARVSPESMNAAMGGGLASFLCMTFFVGLLGYTNALVAQQFGAGRVEKASLAAFQAMIVAVVAWPFLTGLGLLLAPVFNHFNLPPGQAALQQQYFRILMFGTGISLLRGALSGFFCGVGRTRVVMLAALTALTVNALAAWILIFGHAGFPALGIRGAGIGTLLGTFAGFMVLLVAYLAPATRRAYNVVAAFRFDRALMGLLLRFGYPAGLELFFNLLAFNIIIGLLYQQGAATATASTILFNWDMVSFLPLVGVEIGVTSLVGRYVGAHDEPAVLRSARSGLYVIWGFAAVVFVVFMFFPHELVCIFRPSQPDPVFEQATPIATHMLRLASFYVVSNGLFLVYTGALRGAGDTLFTMALTVSLHWILAFTVLIAFKAFHVSSITAWALVVLICTLFPVPLWWRWRSGRWRNAVVKAIPDYIEGFPPARDL